MELYDRVRKIILDETVVRCEVDSNSAIEQYYNDLIEALHIEGFPLISINTIEKKTYILESNKQYFLIFDYYLMEIMHFLNRAILCNNFSDKLDPFFYMTASEECYLYHNIEAAIDFASKYMDKLDDVIEWYIKDNGIDTSSEYLFVQQAFLIAHEFFHFDIRKNPERQKQGMLSKEAFLKKIYNHANAKELTTAFTIADIIKDENVVEECLCDSTAVIQAIDVSQKIGKLDVVESGIAIAMAVMNQHIISVIRDTVHFSGDISYERYQILSSFRLLHLKAFTSIYIKDITSEIEQKKYQLQVENIYNQWLDKVYRPIMSMLLDHNNLLKDKSDLSPEELKRAKKVLKQFFKNCS